MKTVSQSGPEEKEPTSGEWRPEKDAAEQNKWVDNLVDNFLAWYKTGGEEGRPSSSAFTTPPQDRPAFLDLDSVTPDPVAQPCKKRLLAADIRMTKQLEQYGMSKDEIRKVKEENEARKLAKEALKVQKANEKAERDRLKQAKKEQDQAEPGKEDASKKKRAAPAGPLVEACKSFVEARKAEGVKYFQALKLWKESEERRQIVAGLSESEIKRRRY